MELFQLIPGFSRIFQGYIEISGFSRALGTMQASLQAHVTRVYLSITTYLVPQIINFNIKNLGELKLSSPRKTFNSKNITKIILLKMMISFWEMPKSFQSINRYV